MSFGGGYRTFLSRDTLLGVNGFYDTSRLGGTWYSSGSVGLEMAALVGSDAVDVNFNWYGQLFNSNVIRNAFRFGPANFDLQAGYSHELWNRGPDLRLSATAYKFDLGNSVYGWNAGAELKSRDGMLTLRYDVGRDRVNRTWQSIGGFVNVGFQLDNLLKGENPFTAPEPLFRSPRNLRRWLTQTVRRNNYQNATALVAQTFAANTGTGGGRQPKFIFELVNKTNPGLGTTFIEPELTPLTTLTWDHTVASQALGTSYSVAIFDPDGVITTATVPVTLTPNNGTLSIVVVKPDATPGAYSIPGGVARDGTPSVVTETRIGTPGASSPTVITFPATGTIVITGPGVQTLTITVTAQ